MANPQPDKFTRISNELYEAIMQTDFSKRQRKILDLVIRMSYGCGKKWALLRPSDFQVVGVYKGDVRTELTYLATAKVLVVDGERIALNKDYDQWRVSLVKTGTPDRFQEILKRNLSGEVVSETLTEVSETLTDGVSKTLTGVSETLTPQKIELAKHLPQSKQNTNTPVSKILTEIAENGSSTCGSAKPKESFKESFKDSGSPPYPPKGGGCTQPLEEKFPRYTSMQWTVIRDYWGLIATTRKTGAVADSIVEREMQYWERFSPEVVIEALKIHLRRYHTKREEYTRGIMRRIAAEKEKNISRPSEVNWDEEPAAI